MDGRDYGFFSVSVQDLFGLPRSPRVWPIEWFDRVRGFLPFQGETPDSISQNSEIVRFCETFAHRCRDDSKRGQLYTCHSILGSGFTLSEILKVFSGVIEPTLVWVVY